MRVILKENNDFFIRFDRGEEVVEGIKKFCEEQEIAAGFFLAIGAVNEIKLSHYDIETKKYNEKHFNQKLEIDHFFGNIAIMSQQIIIHAHGIFSDKNMKCFGGHVKSMRVAATCEIYLKAFKAALERLYSKEIGLNLIK